MEETVLTNPSVVDGVTKEDINVNEYVILDEEEVDIYDTDVPDMDELNADDFPYVAEDQSLHVEETTELVNVSHTSSLKKRRNLSRSDNFRKFIKRRSKDEDQVDADATAVNDNELNDLLESKKSAETCDTTMPSAGGDITDGAVTTRPDLSRSPTHDSLGRPISGLGPIIAHTSLGSEEEVDALDDDSSSEAGSVHTEDGINDSITNMELLQGYLYTLLMFVLSKLWGFAEMGVTYVYNNYLAGNPAKIPASGSSEMAKDETDTDEARLKQAEVKRKRVFNICNELLMTEREYTKRLTVLVKIKAGTATILQPEIAKSMFQNVEVIQQFHQDNLLPQLEERITNWNDQQRIGDIMRKLVPFLKLYTEYVKSFQKANELFEQWRQKSNTFATFVEEAENNVEYGRLKIQAHMLEPVQRVPRYELLLKDYLKHLPEDSPDRHDAQEALQLVGGAAKHFEEMMKRDSRISELTTLQAQFEGTVNIVSPDRELLHQGKTRDVNSKAGKISDRVLHLFNDLLLVSSHQKYLVQDDKFRVKYELSLKSAKVSYGNNLEVQYTFCVKTPDTVLELSASSAGERRMWMTKITKAVCKLNGTANSQEEADENEASVENSQTVRRYTFQMSADLKTWKKRMLCLYENGLLTTSKASSDRGTLATVHISNFNIGVGTISQKKSKVLTLVGEGRTYYLYDESDSVVESWFEELKTSRDRYQQDGDPDSSLDTLTFVRDSKNRISTASADSGIDAMSYTSQNSQASFDAL